MKENQIEKSPLYLEKLLRPSTMKSNVSQSYNVLEKDVSKRFILPTMLKWFMKPIGSAL